MLKSGPTKTQQTEGRLCHIWLPPLIQPATGPVPDIYLVLTNQMAGWIGSISKLGNWDIETRPAGDTKKTIMARHMSIISDWDAITAAFQRELPAEISALTLSGG